MSVDLGEPAEARRLADAFLAKFPESPLRGDVRLTLARAAATEGKPDEAIAILESLLGLKAGASKSPATTLAAAAVPIAQYELALAYRAVGKTSEADSILAGLAKGPKNPVVADAQFMVGQANLDAGRFADAIAPLEEYLSSNPKGEVVDFAMAHLAMARLGLGQIGEARKLLASVAERFPRSAALPPARLRLGEAELAAHHAERAAEQFRHVAGAGPPSKEPARSAAGKEQGASTDKTLKVRALVGLGTALSELGKPADAAAAFQSALELGGNEPIAAQIALAQGQAHEANRQPEAALQTYALIARKYPKSDQAPLASLASARLLARSGRPGESAQAFEQLMGDEATCKRLEKAGVSRDTLLAEWAYALLDADKPAEADRVFTRLLREFPDGSMADDARFNLAESANQQHHSAEVGALARAGCLEEAQSPANARLVPPMLYRLGRSQIELKDWAAAQATFARLLSECPDSPYRRESKYLGAEAALRQGDAGAALAGFAAVLAEAPAANDPPGMIAASKLKRIQCQVALKQWKEALETATTLEGELKPGDTSIAELDYARGQALLGMGRLADARDAFQKVLDARAQRRPACPGAVNAW